MYVPSTMPKYVCSKCRNKIPVTDLEAVFHEQLKSFFFSPEEVAEHLSNADTAIKEREELLTTLEREEEKVRKEMDRIMRLYLDEQIPQEAVGPQYNPLFERLKQLEEQIPSMQGELDFLKIQRLSSDEILSEARDLYTRWPELAHDEKRNIIEQVTEKITISKDNIQIDLCYLPSSSEMTATRDRNARGSSRRPA
jgi:site-specific DNA recombinase